MGEGAGIEVAFDAFIKAGEKRHAETTKALKGLMAPLPLHPTVVGQATIQTGVNPTVVLPQMMTGPASGRIWNVRTIGVYGGDGHSAVTGVTAVDLYAGDPPDAGGSTFPGGPSLTDLISAGILAVPAFQTYSRHSIWCRHGEVPYALVFGGTVGASLQLVVNVEEWNVGDVEALSV